MPGAAESTHPVSTPQPRPARPADVAQVAAIETASYQNPWPEEFFQQCLRLNYDFWVISSGERVQAYSVMALYGGLGHLMNLCVRSSCRRTGLGRLLLSHQVRLAQRRQCGLFLEVRESNRAARELYRSAGLIVVGHRINYYQGRAGSEDAVIMALPWSSNRQST